MKHLTKRLFAVIAAVIALSGCQNYEDISMALGADVNTAEVLSETDSHGGFHGDGERYMEFQFEGNEFENVIKKDNTWHSLPIKEDTVTAVFYGLEKDGIVYGPYIDAEIPKVEEGYYFIYDRHSDSTEPFDSAEILERGSFNFTAAIYDVNTDRLYYVEVDT